MRRLQELNTSLKKLSNEESKIIVPPSMNSFFGKDQIPRELRYWREAIDDNKNLELAKEWVKGFYEIEQTVQLHPDDIFKAT